jgi:hypothetical protein
MMAIEVIPEYRDQKGRGDLKGKRATRDPPDSSTEMTD